MNETTHSRPKVTVYVPSRQYGKYLEQCLQSLARQTLPDWEAILIDEASTDDSLAQMEAFRMRFTDRVRVLRNDVPRGLRANANTALELARGEYVMRLDADDYLDENALLVLAAYLDSHPDVGLVYPNWTWIDENGGFIGQERRKRLWDETRLPDLPAHGACTMVRRRVLKAIGGYDTDVPAQDGHELWLKTLYRYGVAGVETPLFFYRQHGDSLSGNEARLLDSRRQVKRRIAAAGRGPVTPRIAVVVPVKNTYAHAPNLALEPLAGKPLLDYTLDGVAGDPAWAGVLVATDDPAVLEHCRQRGDVHAYLREAGLSDPLVGLSEVVVDAVEHLEQSLGILPDIVVVLSAHTPLRRREHIQEAIDTLLVYPVEQVLSTFENHDLQYRHGADGMQAVNAGSINDARFEREALYSCNGAIRALWRESVTAEGFGSGRVGHIVMTRTESLVAKKPDEREWLAHLLAVQGARVFRGSHE
ncbi:MAG: glycosyltransferase [Pseudoxanthomonas sp.]